MKKIIRQEPPKETKRLQLRIVRTGVRAGIRLNGRWGGTRTGARALTRA